MTAEQQIVDWTGWIITTLAGVVGTMFAALVGIVRYLDSKYIDEIKLLRSEIATLSSKHQECIDAHHEADIKLAELATQIRITNKHVDNNTKQLKDL